MSWVSCIVWVSYTADGTAHTLHTGLVPSSTIVCYSRGRRRRSRRPTSIPLTQLASTLFSPTSIFYRRSIQTHASPTSTILQHCTPFSPSRYRRNALRPEHRHTTRCYADREYGPSTEYDLQTDIRNTTRRRNERNPCASEKEGEGKGRFGSWLFGIRLGSFDAKWERSKRDRFWVSAHIDGRAGQGELLGSIHLAMRAYEQHKSKEDAWSAFNGKVYNITAYLPFHPGGEDELMRVAGRDGTKLFSASIALESGWESVLTTVLTHSWVNMEYMMQECLIGVLVR